MFSRKNIKNFFIFPDRKTIYRMAFLMYAKFTLNVVYYTVINPLGYCLTVSIMTYGIEGLTGWDSLANSQLYAFNFFCSVLSQATLTFIILSIPSRKDLLYREFGEEYVRNCTGDRPSFALIKAFTAFFCLEAVEWGANTCKLACLDGSLKRSFETLDTISHQLNKNRLMEIQNIDAGVSPDVQSLLVGQIFEKYNKINDLVWHAHNETFEDILDFSLKYKPPLHRLTSFIKEFLGW